MAEQTIETEPAPEPLTDEQLLEAMRGLPSGTKERAAFERIENHQRNEKEFRDLWFIVIGHMPDPAKPAESSTPEPESGEK